MKILIIGANGYLGSSLHEFLNLRDYEVFGVTRKRKFNLTHETRLKYYNINYELPISTQLPENNIDVLINLSSPTAQEINSDPDTNFNKDKKFINNLIKYINKSSIKKVINLSTIHVYSSKLDKEFVESSSLLNVNPYAKFHAQRETHFLNKLNKSKNFINLRLSNVFGAPGFFEGNFLNLFVNDIISQAYRFGKIIIKNNPNLKRNFITISDFCSSMEFFCRNQNIGYPIIMNLGGKNFSLSEISYLIKKVLLKMFLRNIEIKFEILNCKDEFNKFNFNCDYARSIGVKIENNIESEILRLYNNFREKT